MIIILKNMFFVTTITLFFFSCAPSRTAVMGVYVAKENKNIIDTLILEANGSYKQVFRNAVDGKLIYRYTGEWSISGRTLRLDDFIVDRDEPYAGKKINPSIDAINCSFIVQKRWGKCSFGYIKEFNRNQYEQL